MSRFLVVALVLAAACGRKDAQPAAQTSAARDTTPATLSALAPITPVSRATPAPALGRLLIGSWDIFPTGIGGPHLTLTVSSATGGSFRGRLSRALAGDVLLDTDRFRAFTGRIGPDSMVRITIRWVEKGVPPVELAGKASGDEWHLSRFVWGGEEQVLPGRTWTVRKEKKGG